MHVEYARRSYYTQLSMYMYHIAICSQIKNFTKPSCLLYDIEVCIDNFTSFAILLL